LGVEGSFVAPTWPSSSSGGWRVMGSARAEHRRPQEPSVGRRYRPDLGTSAQALTLILYYHDNKSGAAAQSRPAIDAIRGLKNDRAWSDSTRDESF
jgi:hypothetical protein